MLTTTSRSPAFTSAQRAILNEVGRGSTFETRSNSLGQTWEVWQWDAPTTKLTAAMTIRAIVKDFREYGIETEIE